MIYLLLVILMLLMFITKKRGGSLLRPDFVFNFICFVTFLLYSFMLSKNQTELSDRTILILYLMVFSFNIPFLFYRSAKPFSKNEDVRKFRLKRRTEKYLLLITYTIFTIEIIYSRGLPVLWKLTGSSKTYFDFGIASINGAFYGLVAIMGAYSFMIKSRYRWLYLIIPVLIISRQLLITFLLEAIIARLLFMKKKKSVIKTIIVFGIFVFAAFYLMGIFRTGNKNFDDVAGFKSEYWWIGNGFKWVYAYITFGLSNFNNLVSMTPGFVNYGASSFNYILPTIFTNLFSIKENQSFYYIVNINFNVSTFMPEIYLDYGIFGICMFSFIISLIGRKIYREFLMNGSIKGALLYSVYLHNIVMLFFINMFFYLPVLVQFLYCIIIFKYGKIKSPSHKTEYLKVVNMVKK